MNFIAVDIPDPIERAAHLADPCHDICDPCRRGDHGFCRGSCMECGERFHSDPDDLFFLDRGITEDWTQPELPAVSKVDGNL